MNTIINPGELLFLSMLMGAHEVYGVPDIYFGKTDAEIKDMVKAAADSCRKKRWYSVDFSGENKMSLETEKLANVVSFSDKVTEIVLRNTKAKQSRYLFYTKDKNSIAFQENGNRNKLCVLADMLSLRIVLSVLFSEGCMVSGETESFTVTRSELQEIRSLNKNKPGALIALLRDKDIDTVTTKLIAEAASGRAGYFSATTVQILPTHGYSSIFYLADSGLVLQVRYTPNLGLTFERVSCHEAKQTAAAFIGGDFYV